MSGRPNPCALQPRLGLMSWLIILNCERWRRLLTTFWCSSSDVSAQGKFHHIASNLEVSRCSGCTPVGVEKLRGLCQGPKECLRPRIEKRSFKTRNLAEEALKIYKMSAYVTIWAVESARKRREKKERLLSTVMFRSNDVFDSSSRASESPSD